ncbi:hypothetical protein C8Q80DRAFT_335425 [Daedaleopsis nitida]|nr:hypothetical protein C8Q80DRAFT_335425 [Daedaleopsis nitida]
MWDSERGYRALWLVWGACLRPCMTDTCSLRLLRMIGRELVDDTVVLPPSYHANGHSSCRILTRPRSGYPNLDRFSTSCHSPVEYGTTSTRYLCLDEELSPKPGLFVVAPAQPHLVLPRRGEDAGIWRGHYHRSAKQRAQD